MNKHYHGQLLRFSTRLDAFADSTVLLMDENDTEITAYKYSDILSDITEVLEVHGFGSMTLWLPRLKLFLRYFHETYVVDANVP